MSEQMTEPEQRASEAHSGAIGGDGISLAVRPGFQAHADVRSREKVFQIRDLSVHYGAKPAVKDVTMDVHENEITALKASGIAQLIQQFGLSRYRGDWLFGSLCRLRHGFLSSGKLVIRNEYSVLAYIIIMQEHFS